MLPSIAVGQSLSADELKTEVESLKANYEVANTWFQNDANWASNANNLYKLQKSMKGDFWRFGEWATTFAGDKIATWMPLLNSNVESAIASNATISNLWDDVSMIWYFWENFRLKDSNMSFNTDFSMLRPRQMVPFRFPARLIQDFSKQKANMVITRARMVPNGRTTSTGQNVKQ